MAWLLHERRILLPGSAVKVQERTRGPGGRGVSGGADAAGAPRREVGVVTTSLGKAPSSWGCPGWLGPRVPHAE